MALAIQDALSPIPALDRFNVSDETI
jgi:hypothetical protein